MAAPITLTKPQFLATAAAQKPGATYQGYRSYIARARGGPGTALADRSVGMNRLFGLGRFKPGLPDLPPGQTPPGLAAPTDPYGAIIAGLPKPLTNAQLTAEASGEISPLVAAAVNQIKGQTAAATHAIGGYSSDAAAKLAAMDFGAPYAGAEQGQAAVDAALRASLAGAGQDDANALASRLAVINDPTVAAAAQAVAANGAANGTTQVAQGSASLGNLLANAAAAQSYGQKLPGIQQLAGLQDIAKAEQQGQHDIGAQTAQLESQLPSILQGLQGRNDSRAAAIASARQNQLARNDAFAASGAKNQTAITVAQTRANAQVRLGQLKANEQAAADARPNASLSRTVGYVVDANGNWIAGTNGKPQLLPGYTVDQKGQIVKVGKTGSAGGGVKPPTANEINSWVDGWKNGKPVTQTVQAPKPDANGNPVYRNVTQNAGKLSYQQAYDRLTAAHVPEQQARQYLDTAYKRGEQGRGWLTNEEQAALSRSKLPPRAYRYKGVGYIDPKQANALKAAGMQLPPGQWIQGTTTNQDLGPIYVIDETFH